MTMLRQQMEVDTLKRDDLKDGVEYVVEKLEETTTRFGDALLATISFEGTKRKVYMPKYIQLSIEDIEKFNSNALEEKLVIFKKNNLIKIK